ncbi:MAG TPA: hypothetical protein VK453_05425 [Micromonosporaceae bacterium]|nr:hypothetical protein [Micromonosporaceae bacterium]
MIASTLASVKISSGVTLAKVGMLAFVGCVSIGMLSASEAPQSPAPSLDIVGEPGQAFTISGTTHLPLGPDITAPVELTLSNPNDVGLTITTLTVQIRDIRVPAGRGPCLAENFEIHQYSGSYGFVLGALRTATFTDLGIAAAEWPRLTMINLPVNQDACKNAKIALEITGEAFH